MGPQRIAFRILTAIGLAFVAGGCYSALHMWQFLQTAVRTPGMVLGNTWRQSASGRRGNRRVWNAYPQVRYFRPDGGIIIFQSSTGSNPPAFQFHQQVQVLYDPHHPYHAYIDSFGQLWTGSTLLFGLGLGFNVPAIVLAAVRRAGARKEAWLRQNGRRIQADFTAVEQNASLTVNGMHPYRILCQWLDPATNQMHVFHSANIWYNPSKFVPDKTIEVLIDRDNPRRYSVETPFLPKVV